jgi:diguanylate cyclase (GGDEF)-like protein
LKQFRHDLLTWLLGFSNRQLTLFIVMLAVALSLLIVLPIDILWDGKINAELLFAAVVTPLLDALVVAALLLLLLDHLRDENIRHVKMKNSVQEIQQLAHLGSWDLDLQSNRLYWSDEIFRIFEIDPRKFPASYEGFLARVHPEDREKVDSAYRGSLENRSLYEVTHRLLMDDGRIKYVHEHGRSDFDEAGRPLRSIGTVQDVTERVELQQELHRLATTDMLTGIHNRHWLDEQLKREVITSRRYGSPLSIIMFDVDNFKSVNDSHGHEIGDKVLIHVASLAQDLIRNTDLFARWGGEEFMIMCTHSSVEGATLLAERIRNTMEAARCECCKGLKITASFGVTTYEKNDDTESFLKRADDALYKAKHSGKNCVVVDVGEKRKSETKAKESAPAVI